MTWTDDQAECRKLVLENCLTPMLDIAKINDRGGMDVASGPLLQDRKGLIVAKPTKDGPYLRAYIFTKEMTKHEAMQIIIEMAHVCAATLGTETKLKVTDETNN